MATKTQHWHLASDVALAWLILWLVYRLSLHFLLHSAMIWAGAWQDVLLTAVLTLLAVLIGWRWLRLGEALMLPLLAFCTLDARAYQSLLQAMHQGVDRVWLRDSLLSGELLAQMR